MPLSSFAVLQFVDSIAILLAEAYQVARTRIASSASPILRLINERDHAVGRTELLRRELAILRSQRESLSPHRRPDYEPHQRLAILQLKRLHGWSITKTARRFVVHPNTIRLWIATLQGHGNPRLFTDAIKWSRIDDAVRWTAHELRRLCPQPEFGTRSIARQLVRAGIAISRSTVQRVVREGKPKRPRPRRKPMVAPIGIEPHHLLTPAHANHVWHMDLTFIRILWFRFTVAAILDGFSRKLLQLHVYTVTPRQLNLGRLVRDTVRVHGKPTFLITDHGTQFRGKFNAAMKRLNTHHVRGRIRAPYLNGKIERAFRTFKFWWRVILCGITRASVQHRLDDYRHWFNGHRPHSALNGLTPDEAWEGAELPLPIPFRQHDPIKPQIEIRRRNCCGDPFVRHACQMLRR